VIAKLVEAATEALFGPLFGYRWRFDTVRAKVNGYLDIMALQMIFRNTVAISAIFAEFVTVIPEKVLKMG
jgi:hypothetical protein